MKVATIRLPGRLCAVRQDGNVFVEIQGFSDIGALVQFPNWKEIAAQASGPTHPVVGADLAPTIPKPGKIMCIGMNYKQHIVERGVPFPDYPTVFAKFSDSLAGPNDYIPLPPEDSKADWEGELSVIIGKPARRIRKEEAENYIAGYTVFNDISMRGFQNRSQQWLQGKTWENSSPLGPVMVTPDELRLDARIQTKIDGQVVQDSSIDDLLFDIPQIIAYLSVFTTLQPGDVISTGTPSGVGVAQNPKRFLVPGEVLETTVEGIGSLKNGIIEEEIVETKDESLKGLVHSEIRQAIQPECGGASKILHRSSSY